MSGLISGWARVYGLPDPAGPASRVRALGPVPVTEAAARCNSVQIALQAVAAGIVLIAASITRAWSNPRVAEKLAEILRSCRDIAEICRSAASAATAFAGAITTAQREVATAYQSAESVIAGRGLAEVAWLTDPVMMARIDRERCALVMGLYATISAVDRRVDEAADAALAALALDPRDRLTPGMTPATGAAGSADRRNRSALASDLRSPDRQRRVRAAAVARALQHATERGLAAQLLSYRPDDPPGQGGVALAIGDVARADEVTVLVPGVGNSPSAMTGSMDLAATLAAATAAAGPAGSSAATVLWFGYDIPLSWPNDPPPPHPLGQLARAWTDSVGAVDATRAVAAGPRLASFIRGLREMMPPSAGLTLMGHSYGSLVVSRAATVLERGAGVDDIVLLAAPGAGYQVSSSSDYRAVAADHVYTLAFPGDPIPQQITDRLAGAVDPFGALARLGGPGAGSGPFGPDPNSQQFAAQRIAAPSNEPLRGGTIIAQHALSNYLSGPALQAVAAVAAGRYSAVPVRSRK